MLKNKMSHRTWSTDIEITERKKKFSSLEVHEIDYTSLDNKKNTLSFAGKKISIDSNITDIEKQMGFRFRYCEIISKLELSDANIISNFNFNNCLFSNPVSLFGGEIVANAYLSGTYFLEEVIFYDITFKGDVNFWGVVFCENVKFDGCTFEDKLCFENTVFKNEVKFQNCLFKGAVDFRISDTPRDNDEFYRIVIGSFNDSVFEEKVLFYNRYFGSVDFINTKFKKLVDFYNTTFMEPTRFFKTDFEGTCVFAKTTFQELIVFHYTQVSKNMILRNAKFEKGGNFSLINFIDSGYLNVFEIEIKIPKTSISNTIEDIDEGLNWQTISTKHVRETFRMLKNEAIKQNNRIQALEFHSKEMEAYRRELVAKGASVKRERFILEFNRRTNGYGLDWWKGLKTTFICSLALFILYRFSLDSFPVAFSLDTNFSSTISSISKSIGLYAQFFNPTHDLNFMKAYAGTWSVLLDLISRVFIGLGIYQTIQAFRKYGRF